MYKYQKILNEYIEDACAKKNGFPTGYCNIASGELQKILSAQGISTIKAFSYLEKGEGHIFLQTDDGTIIDPTYGQYDDTCQGFIGKNFPNQTLDSNRTTDIQEALEIQKTWLEEGDYFPKPSIQ